MQYWDSVWDKNDIEEYRQYIKGYEHIKNSEVFEFQKHNCRIVCDAACGFGANSLTLKSNGFDVWGFDISENAVWITKELLKPYGIRTGQFKTASLLNTGYPDNFFDAVAVRAALDHLRAEEFTPALDELQRITKENGLLYASFDPLEQDDTELAHIVLEDGSFLYTDESREGLLFRYYSDEEIQKAFQNYEILNFETDARGNRHVVIKW
ncbi:MAG: class I SAM-dependent methyltransferase [Butyrivibrio sp.]|nr:class I SAM-dependent methyltransferase [Acetatifactor muris]MCM1559298.1 class I SAM-dependent methyltransferase [Butyrivibrio sp.]